MAKKRTNDEVRESAKLAGNGWEIMGGGGGGGSVGPWTTTGNTITITTGHWKSIKDGLEACKLTKDNKVAVAKSMVGVEPVAVDNESIDWAGTILAVGKWIVKEYDYEHDVFVYRLATIAERKENFLRA